VVNNGLPLRSDIHTLYDLDLIAIDPDTYEGCCGTSFYLDESQKSRASRDGPIVSSG
jgi:hypothetical protein